MRKRVFKEGPPFIDGRRIKIGALQVLERTVPVVMLGDLTHTVGQADDMQREIVKEGEQADITFDINCWGYDLDLYELALQVYPYRLESETPFVISYGVIRAITMIPIPQFPKGNI